MQVSPQGTVAVAVAKRALALLLCDFLTLLFAIGAPTPPLFGKQSCTSALGCLEVLR